MTREELKEHCKRQIQQFERVEKIMPVAPNDWKRYEEHKMVLELLEQESVLDKIMAEIEEYRSTIDHAISEDELKIEGMKEAYADCLEIIDKYTKEL